MRQDRVPPSVLGPGEIDGAQQRRHQEHPEELEGGRERSDEGAGELDGAIGRGRLRRRQAAPHDEAGDSHEDCRRHDGAIHDVTIRLRDALADQAFGQHDGEHQDRDHSARVEQELHGEQESGVEQEEHDGRRDESASEIEDSVEQVWGEHDAQAPAEQGQGHQPEHHGLERHSLPSLLSARAALGGACMSRSLLPVAHEGGNAQPSQWSRSLSSSISRRSLVARSKVFSMMIASVGHTWTHSSQNSQAYSSSVNVLAKFRFSALSISTLMTWGGQMYSHSRQPIHASWPVSFS